MKFSLPPQLGRRVVPRMLGLAMLLLALFPTAWTQASNSPNPNTTLINARFQQASLPEMLRVLERETPFVFAYEASGVPPNRKFTFQQKKVTLAAFLDRLAAEFGFEYRQIDRTIALAFRATPPNAGPQRIPKTLTRVRGQVKDDQNDDPLVGVTIQVKGTEIGTITDGQGNFQLETERENGTLVFSFIGYEKLEVPFSGGNTNLAVRLKVGSQAINEVVVIGYGTETRGNLSTAIGKVNTKDLQDQPVVSFDQALAGRLAGVDIAQTNGAPGASVAINIRGTSSITGGNAPLIVLDGVPLSSSTSDLFSQGVASSGDFNVGYRINPLSAINPNDIASIEVLKDAASAAIYGSRGSNGVILITTKSGQLGQKPTIRFHAYGGAQAVTKKVEVMDAYAFANYHKLSRDLSWIAKNPAKNTANDPNSARGAGDRVAPYLVPYLNGEPGLTNTDWQDEIFRVAPQQNYELSANGGNNWLSYFVSGNYLNQQGIVINSGMQRYGARLNLNAKLSEKLKFGINLNPSFADHNIVQTEQNWFREGVIITALMYHPNLPVYNADGTYALGTMIRTNRNNEASVATIENPVALANEIDNSLQHTRLVGNTFLEYRILEGLKFKTTFGLDLNFMDRFYYRPKSLNWRTEYAPTTTFNYAWGNNSSIYNWLSENTLEYSKSWKKHQFNGLLGYTAQRERNDHQYLEGRNFPNDNIITLNAAQTRTGLSESREWSLLSYLGRVQYNYEGRYLLSASLRRDGSSRFGENSKWGWFPSASLGWRISKEPFMAKLGAISDLKVRLSYGWTGNTEIPFYGGTSLLGISSYVLSDQVVNGLAPTTSPNPNLSWETTQTLDIGVDAAFFEQKLALTIDYYQSNTEDLLLNVTIPSSAGYSSSLQNIGEMRNRGVELSLSTQHKFGNFQWNGGFNFSANQNRVLALAPGQTQFVTNGGLNDPAFIVRVNEPISSYYGYQVLGVFQDQAQFDATPKLENANQKVGDFIYADVNNDGKVDANDRTILGDNNPDFTWGFQSSLGYKNLELSFNVQAKQDFELFNAMHRYTAEAWGNNLSVYLAENAPRPVWGVGSASHTRPSSWHVEDGSFVRVRNITLAYTFLTNDSGERGLKQLRLYGSALNPFTFTKYSGYNPEVSNNFGDAIRAGEEFGNYPIAKSFILGLNASF